ncbi:LADA_0H10000g1_1 [Lachancea dasiensis]|uniref:Heat shock transcription factor n=1 Tax=Lachancea dasiensis TaxID=1072105 RepID=A0A1G4K2Z8_9SACH|nr:LADA_0H10000g1_1 [Lachancea dasiensis]
MQHHLNATNPQENHTLNDDEIENIIRPSDSIVGQRSLHPEVEDIVNPSWDPTISMSPGHLEAPGNSFSGPGPFSPLISHPSLALPQNESAGNLLRREQQVSMYPGPSSPERGDSTAHDPSFVDNKLMPYRNRLVKASAKPQPFTAQKQPPKRKLASAKTRPAFVNKLWSMVNDTANQELMHWSSDGKSFIITNREQFVHKILPRYFKHSNFASFVRQLNMYGWHKVQDVRSGSIQANSDERLQFENENFIQGCEDLLDNVVRQKPNSNTSKEVLLGQNGEEVDIGILLNELESVKFNQMAIAEDLKRISKDNELLWKDNMVARQRHQAQQQVLNKILHLLASIMGSNTQKLLGNDLANELAQTNASFTEIPNVGRGFWDLGNINNAMTRPRLLLKDGEPDHASSVGSSSVSKHGLNYQSPIQELDRQSINDHQSVSPVSKVDVTNNSHANSANNSSTGRLSEIPFDATSHDDPSFFNDLHSNIKRQGESIQELEDWITNLSPSQEDIGGIPASVSDGTAVTREQRQQQEPPKSIGDLHVASPATFDLQDYLATADPSGFTPLIQDEPSENIKKRDNNSSDPEDENTPASKKFKT